MYHINLGFIWKKIKCILCVVGTSANNYKSKIRNNGEYLYMVKILNYVPILIMDVYEQKSIIISIIIDIGIFFFRAR